MTKKGDNAASKKHYKGNYFIGDVGRVGLFHIGCGLRNVMNMFSQTVCFVL